MYIMIFDYKNNIMEIEFIAEDIKLTIENTEKILEARGYRTKNLNWVYANKDMLKYLATNILKEL